MAVRTWNNDCPHSNNDDNIYDNHMAMIKWYDKK